MMKKGRRQMRNRYRAIGMAVLFLLDVLSTLLYAAEEGTKGTGTRRHLEVHPAGAVHRMGDWFATRRTPKEERGVAMERRRAERAVREAEEKKERDKRRAARQVVLDADKKSRAK